MPGEIVEARTVRSAKSFNRCELLRVVHPSPERVAARCRYFGVCGGCAYQHAPYERQLEWKTEQVKEALERVGRFEAPHVHQALGSPAPYGYRNRITVHTAGGVTGFYAGDGRTLVDIDRCEIASDDVNTALSRHRANGPEPGHRTLRMQDAHGAFEQVNPAMGIALERLVAESLPAAPEEIALLLDLYCGAGALSFACARRVRSVIGVDWSRHNIRIAEETASAQGSNISFRLADVADALPELLKDAPATLTIIADPPRAGLGPRVREILTETPPAHLIYVSCNPATFARDASALAAAGLSLGAVHPLDMFPQTAEIELAAVFRKSA